MTVAMKLFLLSIVLLVCQLSQAQVKMLTRGEASMKGLAKEKMDSIYSGKNIIFPTNRDEFGAAFDSINTNVRSIVKKSANAETGGIRFFAELYVGKNGKFDYAIYELERQNTSGSYMDSTSEYAKHLQTKLASYLNQFSWKSPVANLKLHTHAIYSWREAGDSDSTIAYIETALQTTRPDTVKSLAFNQLGLSSVPEVIYRFPNIEEIDMSDNNLASVAIDVKRLPKLRMLTLMNNPLTNTDLQLPKNKSLKVLNVQFTKLTDIPAAARRCKRLASLWLGNNALTGLNSRSFRKLRRLQDINFYKCGLKTLPKAVRKLRRLEILDVYYNQLTVLPATLSRLKQLQQLAIAHNNLTAIPDKLYKMSKLQALYAHHNNLTTIPENLSPMNQLRVLDVGYNQLSDFPVTIPDLISLQELDLSHNNLSEIPAAMIHLKGLQKFFVRDNPASTDLLLREKNGTVIRILEDKKVEVFY
jgi:Leucine-rich repeat (LRR) protein